MRPVRVNDMDWITSKIAIGNFVDAERICGSEVDAVLCLQAMCCRPERDDVDVLCVPLISGFGNDLRMLPLALKFIHDVVSSDRRMLVHYHAGRSRSVCVVARYFMVKESFTRQQALERIRTKRETYPVYEGPTQGFPKGSVGGGNQIALKGVRKEWEVSSPQ